MRVIADGRGSGRHAGAARASQCSFVPLFLSCDTLQSLPLRDPDVDPGITGIFVRGSEIEWEPVAESW